MQILIYQCLKLHVPIPRYDVIFVLSLAQVSLPKLFGTKQDQKQLKNRLSDRFFSFYAHRSGCAQEFHSKCLAEELVSMMWEVRMLPVYIKKCFPVSVGINLFTK